MDKKILVSIHIYAGNMIVPFFPNWDPDLRNQINNNIKLTVGAEMVGKNKHPKNHCRSH